MAEAFPLAWPHGWDRTPAHKRKPGAFQATADKARRELLNEIVRLGGNYPVISSNVPLRRDGMPFSEGSRAKIADPGVAVYFMKAKRQMVFACDQYDAPWKNIRAIGKTIEAIRGLERWGASDMLERALSAFVALPAPGARYRDVLKLNGGPLTREKIDAQYRLLAQERHPDRGGSDEAMSELNAARDAALKEVG